MTAARFWGAALGLAGRSRRRQAAEALYRRLKSAPADQLHVEVQQVRHESRVHLDIEADDIEAEVRRLEALGARRIANVQHLGGDAGPDRAALLRRARAAPRF